MQFANANTQPRLTHCRRSAMWNTTTTTGYDLRNTGLKQEISMLLMNQSFVSHTGLSGLGQTDQRLRHAFGSMNVRWQHVGRMARTICQLFALLLLVNAASAETKFQFQEVAIDPEAAGKTCYAVVTADVDGDGLRDIVVVTDNRVQWYRQPASERASDPKAWTKHVIIENQTELDNVCIAPLDIDGDGKVDFALGAGWTKVGTIQWISRPEESASDTPGGLWNVYQIGVEAWTHRMRFADVLGEGKPQLVVSPLNATEGNGVRLTAFSIPENPRTDRWQPTVINDQFNRMHNHWHIDKPKGKASTVTASQEGLHLVKPGADGEFQVTKLAGGATGEKPTDQGAGEVKLGALGDRPFMATIEPMHGHSVVVYPSYMNADKRQRVVLDDTFVQGHAIFPADMNGDGRDEVIAAHREPGTGEIKGPGVYLYQSKDTTGTSWTKTIIDNGGMACEDLLCEDMNGDGRLDVVAVGRKTKNVKLYLNQTR